MEHGGRLGTFRSLDRELIRSQIGLIYWGLCLNRGPTPSLTGEYTKLCNNKIIKFNKNYIWNNLNFGFDGKPMLSLLFRFVYLQIKLKNSSVQAVWEVGKRTNKVTYCDSAKSTYIVARNKPCQTLC